MCAMKTNPLSILLIINILYINVDAQVMAQAKRKNTTEQIEVDCHRTIFVQSPVSDTYIAKDRDTVNFGSETTMKVRGLPEKKSMVSLLSYEVHNLDAAYLHSCHLKIYTVSKKIGHEIVLSSVSSRIEEEKTIWINQPMTSEVIDRQSITDLPFVLFDVTKFVRGHLKNGNLDFHIQTDSKKVIDIASRESGLSAELIIEMCTPQGPIGMEDPDLDVKKEGWGLRVLPSDLPGKFTIQVVGVPEGGFGDLMLMTDRGDILRQIPIAIQDADICYHTLDIGQLLPGEYWAVLRKGRAMVRDYFRLRPMNGSTLLQVDQSEASTDQE